MKGEDEKYMRRALDLASLAAGKCRPNPMVGAVIVHNGCVIGEGFHELAGRPHAEPVAIRSVVNKELLAESTIYVTLEPCSHFGRTPPCASLIAKEGIKRVVVGTVDTSSKVSGDGIRVLTEAGCDVTIGVLEKDCRFINRRFFTFHEKKRPWVILKWAESADGYIDREEKRKEGSGPGWITGDQERIVVHKWRSEEHSILIGAGTVRADNPELTARLWEGPDPLRLVLTGSGKIPVESRIFVSPPETIVYSGKEISGRAKGGYIRLTDSIPAAQQIIKDLYDRDVQSVMIEGGASVINHFISEGLWDEARIFKGKERFGSGLGAPSISGTMFDSKEFRSSKLYIFLKEAGWR